MQVDGGYVFTDERGRASGGRRGSGLRRGGQGRAQDRSVVGAERPDEEEALGEAVGAAGVPVPLAAASGLAQAEPASGAVAGAEEAVGVDERFEEDGLVAVAGAPVGRQAADDLAQQAGGQEPDLDPRQDEEGGVIDDEVEAGHALLGGPADEAVAGGDLPGGGGELHGGQETALGVPGEVAELGAAVEAEAEIVPAGDEFAPEGDLTAGGHRTEGDRSEVAEMRGWRAEAGVRGTGPGPAGAGRAGGGRVSTPSRSMARRAQ